MYKCLNNQIFILDNYQLIPLREKDIYLIKKWRNCQIDVLRQKHILTNDDQKKYYETVILPSFDEVYPKQILFSFLSNNELVGYGGLVHISWEDRRAEVSFLLETKRNKDKNIYKEDFAAFIKLIKMIAYNDLEFNRLSTETFDIRPFLISIYEANGFFFEGRIKQHNLINNKFVDSVIHGNLKENEYAKVLEKTNFSVLVTSISKKIPMLKAIKKACNKISNNIKVIGADINSSCIGKHFVDKFWKMPEINNLTIEHIVVFCKQNNVKAIIPSRDGELQFWAKQKNDLAKYNINVMVSTINSINLTLDKHKFNNFLCENSFPNIPTSNNIGNLNANSFVVKERHGAGSTNIGIDFTKEQSIIHSQQRLRG